MDKQELLIHILKILNALLCINDISRRLPPKALAEVLEVAKADILNRWEIYSFDCGSDIHSEEIKKHIESTPYQYLLFGHAPAKKRISSLAENQFLSSNFKTIYRNEIARHQLQGTPHQFLESLRSQLQSLYDLKLDLDSLSLYNDRENSATDAPLPDKEVGTPPTEGEPGQRTVDIARLQALKQIRVSSKDFSASKTIPNEKKVEVFSETPSLIHILFEACKHSVPIKDIKQALQQTAQALQKQGDVFSPQPKQEKALQPPDLSEIPLYRGRQGQLQVGPLDFLKTHYGQWLSVYGAEQDNVFQDQIRAHDPKLIQGVKSQLHREGRGRKVSDIVKTRSARRDRELENASAEDLKRKPQLAATLYSREKRAADKAKAAHSHSVTRKSVTRK